jgi:hypothetical protein
MNSRHGISWPASRFRSRSWSLIAVPAILVGGISLAQAQQEALKSETVDNTRNMRFCEILVVKPRGIEVYNTTGVSDCPAERWNALDVKKLRRQFNALKVEKNGPHFWMMDSQTVSFGAKASFGGIDARWVARLPILTALEAATGSQALQGLHPEEDAENGVRQGQARLRTCRSRRKRLRAAGSRGEIPARRAREPWTAVEVA